MYLNAKYVEMCFKYKMIFKNFDKGMLKYHMQWWEVTNYKSNELCKELLS